MVFGHKIKEKMDKIYFCDIISQYEDRQIVFSAHTFTRLNEQQRKIFKHEVLLDILRQEPIFVGIQQNNLIASFYSYEQEIIRVVLDIRFDIIKIVTFYTAEVPRIK